jgi:hypothetical protein
VILFCQLKKQYEVLTILITPFTMKKLEIKTYQTIILIFTLSFAFQNVNAMQDTYTFPVSIQKFGVLPGNKAELNRDNLQKAIDWASSRGSALYVEPVSDPYETASCTDLPFITVETGSQIRRIQFRYPYQTIKESSKIIVTIFQDYCIAMKIYLYSGSSQEVIHARLLMP